ncbi:hypothetical protein [Acinetobacter tibetensis]|uniref:Uncharacterized protein n=1 Tax=Acinetobacter tibetensis TaxID=2943497 RepID=A0AAE9LSZ4_9GAMM|nr:hypothetical protein [Acinetobacter tibetensis]USE84224.1 hypothetical protein M5E07_05325 [Acinetobacter tibetensis]
MNTLSIPEIFSQFSYYQENYLSLIQQPELYYTAVEGAFVSVRPFATVQLYLGDLLQLWFSEKWLVESARESWIATYFSEQIEAQERVYIYALEGQLWSKPLQAQAWLKSEHASCIVQLEHTLKYYCYYKALSAPQYKLKPA